MKKQELIEENKLLRQKIIDLENKDEYNGWTNYETWCLHLWMTNDKGSYNHYTERASQIYATSEKEKFFTRKEAAIINFYDEIKDHIEGAIPLTKAASVYADLMNAAISSINWYEVSQSFFESYPEEA